MEINLTAIDQLLQTEEISGFEDFLAAMNFTMPKNETTTSVSSEAQVIVMLILCMVALILNCFAICATYHIPNKLTTHSKLIISLALSDILIVLSVFAHQISKILHKDINPFTATAGERKCLSCSFAFISSLNITAHLISLLNLLMMAADHYLAIIKPYQYAFLLNKRNGIIIIIAMWVAAFIGGFINFLSGLGSFDSEKSQMNYCEYIMYNDFQGDYLVIACTFICLLSIMFIYCRIYHEVRKMNRRLTLLTFNKEHNAKTLFTTMLIIGTFMICWIPLFTFQTILLVQVHLDRAAVMKTLKALIIANKYLYALLIFNSICDPIIYAVRLKEVQLGYKQFWKSLCGKYAHFPSQGMRKTSLILRLLQQRKSTNTDNETNERTLSLVMSENEKEKEKSSTDFETENNNIPLNP